MQKTMKNAQIEKSATVPVGVGAIEYVQVQK